MTDMKMTDQVAGMKLQDVKMKDMKMQDMKMQDMKIQHTKMLDTMSFSGLPLLPADDICLAFDEVKLAMSTDDRFVKIGRASCRERV